MGEEKKGRKFCKWLLKINFGKVIPYAAEIGKASFTMSLLTGFAAVFVFGFILVSGPLDFFHVDLDSVYLFYTQIYYYRTLACILVLLNCICFVNIYIVMCMRRMSVAWCMSLFLVLPVILIYEFKVGQIVIYAYYTSGVIASLFRFRYGFVRGDRIVQPTQLSISDLFAYAFACGGFFVIYQYLQIPLPMYRTIGNLEVVLISFCASFLILHCLTYQPHKTVLWSLYLWVFALSLNYVFDDSSIDFHWYPRYPIGEQYWVSGNNMAYIQGILSRGTRLWIYEFIAIAIPLVLCYLSARHGYYVKKISDLPKDHLKEKPKEKKILGPLD